MGAADPALRLWDGSFFFTGVAVRLPPLTIVVLRVGLAALVLNAALPLMRLRMPTDAATWRAFFAMGFINNVLPFCLIVWGQTQIASGLASILNATTPLATVLVAHVLTRDEKMTGNKLAGVVIGLIGVVAMVGPSLLDGLGRGLLAQLAVLMAAVSYAFAAIYGRRFKRMGLAPMVTATGLVTAATIVLLPVALLVDRPWTLMVPSLPAWAALVVLAVLSTAFAYLIASASRLGRGHQPGAGDVPHPPVPSCSAAWSSASAWEARHFLGMALIGIGLCHQGPAEAGLAWPARGRAAAGERPRHEAVAPAMLLQRAYGGADPLHTPATSRINDGRFHATMTRRLWLAATLAGLGLVSGLAGAAQAAEKLRLLTWADYAPADVVQQFTKETGIEVEVTLSNNEEMISKLRATQGAGFDLVQPSQDRILGPQQEFGIYKPLDLSKLKGDQFIASMLDATRRTPSTYKVYAVPHIWGTDGWW
jgi:drug/metabolite transporter (DMT)-like permease